MTLLPGDANDTQKLTYSQLIAKVETDPTSIKSVLFVPKSREIQAELTDGSKVKVNYPTDQPQFASQERLEDASTPIAFDSKGTGDSAWWALVPQLLPFLLFFVV